MSSLDAVILNEIKKLANAPAVVSEPVHINGLLAMDTMGKKYVSPSGAEYLRSGYVETNLVDYPDATPIFRGIFTAGGNILLTGGGAGCVGIAKTPNSYYILNDTSTVSRYNNAGTYVGFMSHGLSDPKITQANGYVYLMSGTGLVKQVALDGTTYSGVQWQVTGNTTFNGFTYHDGWFYYYSYNGGVSGISRSDINGVMDAAFKVPTGLGLDTTTIGMYFDGMYLIRDTNTTLAGMIDIMQSDPIEVSTVRRVTIYKGILYDQTTDRLLYTNSASPSFSVYQLTAEYGVGESKAMYETCKFEVDGTNLVQKGYPLYKRIK